MKCRLNMYSTCKEKHNLILHDARLTRQQEENRFSALNVNNVLEKHYEVVDL